jgi:hypothetical protein
VVDLLGRFVFSAAKSGDDGADSGLE